jgi:hypothetical protein
MSGIARPPSSSATQARPVGATLRAGHQAPSIRRRGAPLPEYLEQLDPEPPTDHLASRSALRSVASAPPAGGHPGPATRRPLPALPHGILFLDTTLSDDDLATASATPPPRRCTPRGPNARRYDRHKRTCATGLQDFFKDVHRKMYENRPIHWPLSSANKTFVAWVNIHRLTDQTLQRRCSPTTCAGARSALDGELTDLRAARDGADKKAARRPRSSFGEL